MNPKTLFIYEYQILYEILNEIKEYLDFEIINLKKDKVKKIEFNKFESFLGLFIFKPKFECFIMYCNYYFKCH